MTSTIDPTFDPALVRPVVHDDLFGVDVPPERLVQRMVTGSLLSRSIYVLCKTGIPDLCAEQPRTVGDLAAASGTDAPALGRFLRVLAAVGLFEEDAAGRFHVTDLGALLCIDTPGSMQPFALMIGDVLEPPAAAVLYALRTGKPAFDHVHGCGIYEHLAAHPEKEALFASAMTQRAARLHESVLDAVDWSGVGHIVDVGGNRGGFLGAILRRLPATTAVLFDQPQVVAGASAELEAAGVADRVDVEGGDFFVSVPSGGDLYLLANVLWNWDDGRATVILRRCRDAMAGSARLAICEPVVPAGNEPHPAKQLDLANFLMFGGRTRRADEWRDLLAECGFDLVSITETAADWSVIDAAPSPAG